MTTATTMVGKPTALLVKLGSSSSDSKRAWQSGEKASSRARNSHEALPLGRIWR